MAHYTVWVETEGDGRVIFTETDDLHEALGGLGAAAALVSGGATGVGMDIGAGGHEEQQPADQHQQQQPGAARGGATPNLPRGGSHENVAQQPQGGGGAAKGPPHVRSARKQS